MPTSSSTGTGLLFPLHREHGDFASAADAALLKSNIKNVLGVRASAPDGKMLGEYAWNLAFGSGVDRLRHANLDAPSREDLTKIAVTDAVAAWEPRARVATEKTSSTETDDGLATALSVKFTRNTDDQNARAVDVIESTEVRIG